MTSFGVIEQGFNLKTFQDILDEIETQQRAAFGSTLNQQADSVIGILNGIIADKLAEINELAQAVRAARSVSGASGANLDDVLALAGIARQTATPSNVALRMNLAAGTTVTAGKTVSVGPGGDQWTLRTAVTNSDSNPRFDTGIFDSVVAGAVSGNASSIDTIVTPVSGWTAKAGFETAGSQPFPVTGGDSIILGASGGIATINFITADFAIPGAATAAEIATKINASTALMSATALSDGRVRLEDVLDGSGSFIEIVTVLPGLPFPQEQYEGFNPSTNAYLIAPTAGPYNMTGGGTLTISRNGSSNTVTFASNASTSALSAAQQINTQLSAANINADVVNGSVRISGGQGFSGSNISIQVTGGTFAMLFNFSELVTSGTSGDATLGRNDETDAEFKQRYFASLSLPGSGTVNSIRAAVSNVSGVSNVSVLDNPTDTTDGNGIMPYGVLVIAAGGTDADVAQAIFSKLAAGTPTYRDPGSAGRTIQVLDENLQPHNINFSRPTEVPIYVTVTVLTDVNVFGGGDPVAGAQAVADAIKTLGDTLQTSDGDDVIALRYEGAPFSVPGVIDVTSFLIDITDPPTSSSNISIPVQSYATFSTSRIIVTVVS